jgi:glycosyltransferase involved in cell wall biosynthesis
MKRKKALVLITYYLPGYKSGGIAVSVSRLLQQLPQIDFDLLTKNHDLGLCAPYEGMSSDVWVDRPECRAMYLSSGWRRLKTVVSTVLSERYHSIFINGIFSMPFSFLPLLVLRLFGQTGRVIVAPHGDLLLSMARYQSVGRKILLWIMRQFGLFEGVRWRASTKHEMKCILNYFPGAQVDVILDLPKQVYVGDEAGVKKPGHLRMVFLSRIVPSKNLAAVVEYAQKAKGSIELDIYGPAEDQAYFDQIMKRSRLLRPDLVVRYCGACQNDQVMKTLAQYDLFVLLSFSENYGYVINEALCAGTPVMLSDCMPWKAVVEAGAGFVFPLISPDPFVACINEFVAMDESRHAHFRIQAKKFATSHADQRHLLNDYERLFDVCQAS